MDKSELSVTELTAIRDMKTLAKRWPKTLWLFVGGSLDAMTVMKCGPNGERVHGEGNEGVGREYIVDSINIPCDGGDF